MTPKGSQRGFTLIEALASLAIVAAILIALSAVSGQWLPHWRRGFEAAQNADLVAQSLDRLTADLSAAQFARLGSDTSPPLFRGEAESVIFVRAANGPGATPRLDYVRIGSVTTNQGPETQRARAVFAPGPIAPFRDAATVLRAPFRLSLAYQTTEGQWTSSWSAAKTLPRAIRLTVKNGSDVVASTAFLLKTPVAVEFGAQPTPTATAIPSKAQ